MSLLQVRDLTVSLPGSGGWTRIVDGVSFDLDRGQVLGLAGESGSGKTMTALTLLRLLPPRARIEGSIRFGEREVTTLDRRGLEALRGREIAMVFQDPRTSLHPLRTVGRALTDQVRHHFGVNRAEASRRAVEALRQVRLPDPEGSLGRYPHQFSGGMRQRIAIAAALVCDPAVLIADEPTTALDVTVQAGVLQLLDRLRDEVGLAVLFISHDLGVMSTLSDNLAVMYGGRIVESGPTSRVLQDPRHPYTEGLLRALPGSDRSVPLTPIPGAPPATPGAVSGCAFHPRCPLAVEACSQEPPPLIESEGRRLACYVRELATR